MRIKMITAILLLTLFLGELFFVIWNCKGKSIHRREKMLYRYGMLLLLTCLVLTGVLKGTLRYGMLLFLLFVQGTILLLQTLRRAGKEGADAADQRKAGVPRQVLHLLGTMVLFGIALIPAIFFPQYQPLKPTGDYEICSVVETWEDQSRIETYSDTGENRKVTIKIWYPKENGTYPLAVFSHGAGGMLESNASTCEELASHGYVAVSIAHPYQAAFVEDTSGKVTLADQEFMSQVMTDNGSDTEEHEQKIYQLQKEWMEIRTGDENFVLDTLLQKAAEGEGEPYDRIDAEKIGLFGHSLGGATSVAVGRQRKDISAVIDIEGTMLAEYTGYENGKHSFQQEPYPVPLLDINSRKVYELAKGYPQEYVNFYVGEHAVEFREVVFEDAGHMNFCDLSMVSPILAKILGTGKVNARKCLENLNEIVLNYFDYYLKGKQGITIADTY